jgi:MFS family permease
MGAFYTAFFAEALLRRVLTYSIVLYGASVLGGGTWSGALYVCLVAPYLLSIYAGSLIDTARRTSVLRVTSTLTLALIGGITACASSSRQLPWVLAAIILCYGIVSAFAYPAFITGTADLVEPSRVGHSTIVMNTLSLATQVAAPVFVGVLRAFVSWPTFFLCATSIAVVQCAALRLVNPPRPVAARTGRTSRAVALSPWADIAEVRAFNKTHATLPTLLLAVTLFSALAIGPLEVLVPLFASATLRLSSATAGAFMATGGIGLVIGAIAALKLAGRRGMGAWLCGTGVAGGVVILAMTVVPTPIAFALYFVGGLLAGMLSSLSLAAIQQAATSELRGRVIGLFSLVLGAPPAIGGAAAGALSDAIGTPAALRIVSCLFGAAFVLLYATRPALRNAGAANLPSDGTPQPA